MPTVALVGVHGVGKSYTAKVLGAKYGFSVHSIDVINIAYGLPPLYRQLTFFAGYIEQFIQAVCSRDRSRDLRVVVDSHPILVLPYTEYMLANTLDEVELHTILDSMLRLVLRLPKVDLLVLIHPKSIDTVMQRIAMRNRFNLSEELNREYVSYIVERTYTYVTTFWSSLARRFTILPAELEGEKRADLIARELDLSP